MKFKIWKFAEISFDKSDAEVVIPFILMLLLIYFKAYKSSVIIIAACLYYLFYFLYPRLKEPIRLMARKINCMKCPKCKNKNIIYQGMYEYKSDVPYDHYLCAVCNSIFIDAINGLILTHDSEQDKPNTSKISNEFNDDMPF